MSDLLSELRTMGCDIDGAMDRFLNDEEFYKECYVQVLEDPAFEKLKESLEAGEVTESFNYAHTLKGVIANMGLTPLYDIIVKIVEPLRAGSCDNLMGFYNDLITERGKYQKLV